MFENVEQLEREIKEFEQNILASKALIQNIKEATAAIKQQNERFGDESDRLILRINEVPADIDETVKENINRLIEENKNIADGLSAIASEVKTYEGMIEDKYDAMLSETMQKLNEVLSEVSSYKTAAKKGNDETILKANEMLMATVEAAAESFKTESGKYTESLDKLTAQLTKSEAELESKYKELIAKSENTNGQIIKELAELKSTVNSKNTLIMILVVVSIVVSAVAIVL